MNIRSKIFGNGKDGDDSPLVQSKTPKGAKADALHSIAVARETTRKADTRDEDRHRLPDEQVSATYKGRKHNVQLINLSGGGAMVASDFEPRLWDRLQLHLGENGTIECAVRWLKGDRIGLEFAHETRLDCSADKQAAVLREVIARSFPDIEFEGAANEAEATTEAEAPDYDELRGDRRHPRCGSGPSRCSSLATMSRSPAPSRGCSAIPPACASRTSSTSAIWPALAPTWRRSNGTVRTISGPAPPQRIHRGTNNGTGCRWASSGNRSTAS